MYKIEYFKEPREKDLTYDDAFYNCLNNHNTKWENFYTYLKEKYDLCYNVESIVIDVSDIKKMQYDCFSDGILLKLYNIWNNNPAGESYDRVRISNNSIFAEELIYNIIKSNWLIDEEMLVEDKYELDCRRRYFKAMIEASENVQDIKIQFRNKLFEYFIETYDMIKNNENNVRGNKKILKLEKTN